MAIKRHCMKVFFFFYRSFARFFFLDFMNTKQNVTAWAPRNSIKQILRTQPGQKKTKSFINIWFGEEKKYSSYQYVRKHRISADLGWIQSENITKKVATKLASIDHLNSFPKRRERRKRDPEREEKKKWLMELMNLTVKSNVCWWNCFSSA